MHRTILPWAGERHALASAPFRYALLDRIARAARRRAGRLVAFSLSDEGIRLVLDATPMGVQAIVHAVRSGTARTRHARDAGLLWGAPTCEVVALGHTLEAIAWAHRAALADPLTDPWTSHRDWLGLREAPFFDADVRAFHDPAEVAIACGSAPPVVERAIVPPRTSPVRLMKVAGAVHGRLAADRRCFGVYSHLARAAGRSPRAIADDLQLTRRRIHQLLQDPEPLLPAAIAHLAEPRLAAVP